MNERERLASSEVAALLQAVLETDGFESAQARVIAETAHGYRNVAPWANAAMRVCQSPIERRFLLACMRDPWLTLQYQAMWDAADHGLSVEDTGVQFGFDDACEYDLPSGEVLLFVKPQASPYLFDDGPAISCDFSVQIDRNGWEHTVYVELDGHEWHERTKEQASADRRRDRRIAASGATVFRFTGADVNADATACEREVIRSVCGWITSEIDAKSQAEWCDWHYRRGRVRTALEGAFRDGFTRGRSHQRSLRREATCR